MADYFAIRKIQNKLEIYHEIFCLCFINSKKMAERKTRRQPGEEGYDPFDFETNDEDTADEDGNLLRITNN